jgi:hypothetical protein
MAKIKYTGNDNKSARLIKVVPFSKIRFKLTTKIRIKNR